MDRELGADSFLQLVNSQPWECDKVTLHLGSQRGMLEAEATFRDQLVIMRMKGRLIILGVYCTFCMLYLVYAVLGVCCTWCHLTIMTWRNREG
jgi:hypothetical protein